MCAPRPFRVLVLGVVAALALGCARAPESSIRIEEADWLSSPSPEPPRGELGWTRVALPDRWDLARRRLGASAWYRLRVEMAGAPTRPWVVFLEGVRLNADVYVNSTGVGSGGRMDDPPTRNVQRPLAFVVSPGVLKQGPNDLHIRVVTSAGTPGLLHPVRVGPEADFAALREETARTNGLIQLSGLLAFLLGCICLFQARGRSSDEPGLAWFGAALLFAAGFHASVLFPDARIPSRAVEWFVGSSFHASLLCFAVGVRRAVGGHANRREQAWLWLYGALSLVYAIVPAIHAYSLWAAWGIGSLLLSLQAAGRVCIQAFRTRRAPWVAGSFLLALLFLGVFVHAVSLRAGFGAAWAGALIGALLLGGGLILLLARLHRLIGAAEEQSDKLAAQVAVRESELEDRHARILELERERIVAIERERLTQEMHDGAGGLLVAALSLVRRQPARPPELESLIEDALDDLRLTLDSLEPDGTDLPLILGVLRPRLERVVTSFGLRLDWQVSDAGDGQPLEPEALLHVVRIVQESVANAARHSGGRSIRVRTGEGDGSSLWLEIADDGRGGAAETAESDAGRGLAHVKRRAESLGGVLDISSGREGTRLRVEWPVTVQSGFAEKRRQN